jgi:hypothetical protein
MKGGTAINLFVEDMPASGHSRTFRQQTGN